LQKNSGMRERGVERGIHAKVYIVTRLLVVDAAFTLKVLGYISIY
jgi:hypothetical protein